MSVNKNVTTPLGSALEGALGALPSVTQTTIGAGCCAGPDDFVLWGAVRPA
jgi:hypothetical protein